MIVVKPLTTITCKNVVKVNGTVVLLGVPKSNRCNFCFGHSGVDLLKYL